jgi:hypothetical protein
MRCFCACSGSALLQLFCALTALRMYPSLEAVSRSLQLGVRHAQLPVTRCSVTAGVYTGKRCWKGGRGHTSTVCRCAGAPRRAPMAVPQQRNNQHTSCWPVSSCSLRQEERGAMLNVFPCQCRLPNQCASHVDTSAPCSTPACPEG